MQENLEAKSSPKVVSRRSFLRGVRNLVIVAGAASVGGVIGYDLFKEEGPSQKERPLPDLLKEKFNDILTPEELNSSNIKIDQAGNTQLYLRRSALEFPLFHDAANGDLKEVNIILLDHPSINWSAREGLPEEAKRMWEAVHGKSDLQSEISNEIDYLNSHIDSLLENNSDFLERLRGETDPGRQKYYEGQIQAIDRRLEELRGGMKILERGKTAGGLDEYYDQSGPIGSVLWDGRIPPIREDDYPEFKLSKKAYLLLAVGGTQSPKPSDSYPRPEMFPLEQIPGSKYQVYDYSGKNLGFVLRKSLESYDFIKKNGWLGSGRIYVNHRTFNTISKAWEKYQDTADTGGYPFVFVNKNGITTL